MLVLTAKEEQKIIINDELIITIHHFNETQLCISLQCYTDNHQWNLRWGKKVIMPARSKLGLNKDGWDDQLIYIRRGTFTSEESSKRYFFDARLGFECPKEHTILRMNVWLKNKMESESNLTKKSEEES